MLSLFLAIVSIPVLANHGHDSTGQHVLEPKPEISSAKAKAVGSWNAADSKRSVVSCMLPLLFSGILPPFSF